MSTPRTRYVQIGRFCELTGYTRSAVDQKRSEGVWLEGYEYIRAPDNRILMDLDGYERWAEGRRAAA